MKLSRLDARRIHCGELSADGTWSVGRPLLCFRYVVKKELAEAQNLVLDWKTCAENNLA